MIDKINRLLGEFSKGGKRSEKCPNQLTFLFLFCFFERLPFWGVHCKWIENLRRNAFTFLMLAERLFTGKEHTKSDERKCDYISNSKDEGNGAGSCVCERCLLRGWISFHSLSLQSRLIVVRLLFPHRAFSCSAPIPRADRLFASFSAFLGRVLIHSTESVFQGLKDGPGALIAAPCCDWDSDDNRFEILFSFGFLSFYVFFLNFLAGVLHLTWSPLQVRWLLVDAYPGDPSVTAARQICITREHLRPFLKAFFPHLWRPLILLRKKYRIDFFRKTWSHFDTVSPTC